MTVPGLCVTSDIQARDSHALSMQQYNTVPAPGFVVDYGFDSPVHIHPYVDVALSCPTSCRMCSHCVGRNVIVPITPIS
jgi:hypothetical protein